MADLEKLKAILEGTPVETEADKEALGNFTTELQDEARIQAFLAELTALTQKYHISIGGCGCDGSPWLNDENSEHSRFLAENLDYEDGKYVIDK